MALARKLTSKIYEIQAHTQKVNCLDVGITGRVLVTGGQDRNVKLWALGNEKCFMTLDDHTSPVDCVKFAYKDDFVYSADDNGVIKRWDLNSASGCTTLYGHMKSVKTLDFHPYGEYVISGSNDTTIRLWDVRDNVCIKKYRGHIANVNSVKFSPDGSWIASAGTEGSIIIWDIRMSKQIIEFVEHSSPITCLQFHPYEFLLAAGRNDGTVDLYDLEKRKLITSINYNRLFMGHPVACVTFSEKGQCLFVGTAPGISVVGWEPDREFDHIESSWSILGDMKVLNKQLYCGAYENQTVSVHALNIDQVIPFYNPSNKPFSHNQGSRKSFSNRTGKLRLSIGNKSQSKDDEEKNHISTDGGASSPNLSIEIIDEEDLTKSSNNYQFENYISNKKSEQFDTTNTTTNYTDQLQLEKFINNQTTFRSQQDGYDKSLESDYTSDQEYYPIKNISNMNNNIEREDFPVNNAQPPDYAPKLNTLSLTKIIVTRHKLDLRVQRRASPPNISVRQQQHGLSRKMTVSSTELNKIDNDNYLSGTHFQKKTISRGASPIRSGGGHTIHQNKIKKSESTINFNKENNLNSNKNKNIPVHIVTKPIRSKTSIDIKSLSTSLNTPSTKISNYVSDLTNESHEMQLMTTCHESVYQSLRNRHTSLQIIRAMKSNDLAGTIKNVTQMNDQSVLADILGTITENTIPLNLDVCVTLLPELYELLRSEYKFHYMRACDTLRTILTTFLPIIRANVDPWSPAKSLGVDISREERQNKCIECKQWLLRIRCLPENKRMGSQLLTQLQNMIVDL